MHRFFLEKKNILNDTIVIQGSDATHIRNVLRLHAGEEIEVFVGQGLLYLVRLEEVRSRSVKGKIVSSEKVDTESPLKIHLGQSLIKGNKFDVVLRKSVELGVQTITPLMTDRTILKGDNDKKIPRWKKIVEESSKQCGISCIPQISETVSKLDVYCRQATSSNLKLMFWEMEKEKGLKDIKPINAPRSVHILIGPEGGFTLEEVETARSYGFQTLGLGPRIFRAETAPLVVLSLLQSRWGDIG
ncbi:MAG: 16S rRNA (uracil(1498)-N(3))-methyltransferase [Nitrospinota bacterium]|nr:16S rRNA (uracil(1498)-N(3))-methyltransferase [Nitrospinota bacterium]